MKTCTMSPMLTSYIAAALWSSMDDDCIPLDSNYSASDIAPDALARMEADCAAFVALAGDMIAGRESDAGHDLWLTRNRHGAGFWDGDWENGERLTEMAHSMGECDLYVGDDGMLHI